MPEYGVETVRFAFAVGFAIGGACVGTIALWWADHVRRRELRQVWREHRLPGSAERSGWWD